MVIDWIRCASYAAAQNFSRVIYLHEWNDAPFYWGKSKNSFFGGGMRTADGLKASGRYNSGYRHWIEGCLQHGAKLYIGRLDSAAVEKIDEIENYLICTYGHVMNTRIRPVAADILPRHVGTIPASILNYQRQGDAA